MIATVAVLGVVYTLLLKTPAPSDQLKLAFANTFDTSKTKTLRYDVVFTEKDKNARITLNGQYANGDNDITINAKIDDQSMVFRTMTVDDVMYIQTENPSVLTTLREAGYIDLPDVTIEQLQRLGASWLKLNGDEQLAVLGGLTTCTDKLSSLGEMTYPLMYLEGPYDQESDETLDVFMAQLDPTRQTSSAESLLLDPLCKTDSVDLRPGERYLTADDLEALKLRIGVDGPTRTVRSIQTAQFSWELTFNAYDRNKDVTIAPPTESVEFMRFIDRLPKDLRPVL